MIYNQRFAQYGLMAFVVAAMVATPLAPPLNGMVQHSTLANNNLQLTVPQGFEVRFDHYFVIEHDGEEYTAYYTINNNVDWLESCSGSSPALCIYQLSRKDNWLVVDSNGVVVRDTDRYRELAFLASVADKAVGNWQYSLQEEANRYKEVLLLGAVAEFLQRYYELAASYFGNLVADAELGPVALATAALGTVEGLAEEFVLEIVAASSPDLTTEDQFKKAMIARTWTGVHNLERADAELQSMDLVFGGHFQSGSLHLLETYVRWGRTHAYSGAYALSQSYDQGIVDTIVDIALSYAGGYLDLPTAITNLLSDATMEAFLEIAADMDLRFRLWEDGVKDGAVEVHDAFLSPQLVISTDKTVYAPEETVILRASVADVTGTPLDASVSYVVEGTDKQGSMPGSNGEYGYSFHAPATPGNYKIIVTAETQEGTTSKEIWIMVSSGSISVDTTSIDVSLPGGGVASQPVRITNVGAVDLKDVRLTKTGEVADWISFASSDIGWDAGSSSFSEIPATGDTDREVTITISVPEGATPATRYTQIKIVALGGESFSIPVTVNVVETGGTSRTKYLADDSSSGWDVYKHFDYIEHQGHTDFYTIRSNPITLNKNVKTEVGRFDISDLGLSSIDPWGGIWIEWSVLTEGISNGAMKVDVNGREDWADFTRRYYTNYVFCDKKETDNIVQMTYYYGDQDSVVLDDIKVRLKKYAYGSRDWEDTFSLSTSHLENMQSAYLQFDIRDMMVSPSSCFPVEVYLNGQYLGDLNEGTDRRIGVAVTDLRENNTVRLTTHTDSIYNISNAEFHYTYIRPVDIDVDFTSSAISVKVNDEFTVSGSIRNDGDETATSTRVDLSYDSSKLQLVSGSSSYYIGNLAPRTDRSYNWTFRALKPGSHTIGITGSSDQDSETDALTVSANSFGVDLSARTTSLEITSTLAQYDITVQNTGTARDTFTLSLNKSALPEGWDAYLDTYSVELDAAQSTQIHLAVSTTEDEGTGAVIVTATSGTDTSKWDSLTFETTKVLPSDMTPPETIIVVGPEGTIHYNDVVFMWEGSDNWTPTADLVYSCYLAGYDSNWSDWGSSTSKQYTDLPPGDYTFKVKARDQAGNEDPTPAERSFTVITPTQVFTGSDFSCACIEGGHECSIYYTNNLGEDAVVVFLYTDSTGKVVSAPEVSAPQGSGTASSRFYCDSVDPGTYQVSWRAYKESDTTLSDPVAWSKSYEVQHIECPACLPDLSVFDPEIDGCTVTINGVVTSPCNDPVQRIHWNWGDGTENDSWFPATHIYTQTGMYIITVTAHTAAGCTATETKPVSVSCEPSASISIDIERATIWQGTYSGWTVGDQAYVLTATLTSDGQPITDATLTAEITGPNGEVYWFRDGSNQLYDTIQAKGMDEEGRKFGPIFGGTTDDGIYANFLELDDMTFGADSWTIKVDAFEGGDKVASETAMLSIAEPTGNFGHYFKKIDLDTSTPEEDWIVYAQPGQTFNAEIAFDEANPCDACCVFYIRAWGGPYEEWGDYWNVDSGCTSWRNDVVKSWTWTASPTPGDYTLTLNDVFAYWWPFYGEGVFFVGKVKVSAGPCYDFDNSGQVDVADIMRIANRWRTSCDNPDPDNNPGTLNYESRYDLNHDCEIDIVDIMMVAAHWGETWE